MYSEVTPYIFKQLYQIFKISDLLERTNTKQHDTRRFIARQGLSCFNEKAVESINIGHVKQTCKGCGALLFQGEKNRSSIHCSNSSIKLPPVKEPPELLKKLLKGNSKRP